MVKVSLNLLKELKWLIGFFGLTSITIVTHMDTCLDFLIKYDIHIFLLCLFGFWFIYIVLNAQIGDMHRDQLRKQIKDLAIKLHDVEVIDKEDTIKYILDLRASQIKLELNGYSQRALDSMEARIKI